MKNKYLILKGVAGLGNRLITLSNAIEYAKSTNRILLVDWTDGQFGYKNENVFYKFFRLNHVSHIKAYDEIGNLNRKSSYPKHWIDNIESSVYDNYLQDSSKYLSKFIPHNVKGKISMLKGYWRFNKLKYKNADLRAFISLFDKNSIPFGAQYKKSLKEDVVFFIDFCPAHKDEILLNNIDINEDLKTEVQFFAEKNELFNNTIGVHVRMTDKKPKDTLDNLAEKIRKLNLDNPKIFLATDNKEAEIYFNKNFKNVIYTNKWRPENYGEKMGIHQYAIRNEDYVEAEQLLKESIMDMWLLSKCEYLIYQKNSTFSVISSILKNDKNKIQYW